MKKLQQFLALLMIIYAFLFLLVNFDFKTNQFSTDNWIEYVLLIMFYILLLQFWLMVRRVSSEQINQATITDATSGLYTAHHFFTTLGAEIDRSRRKVGNLSLLLMDIDYFHRFNESHGVKAGNRVLRYLGQIIVNSTRMYDSGFRFGSDNFALLLPETDRVQAREIAERLREAFSNNFKGELGLSIGVASFDEKDNVDRMIRKAEIAMDESRRGGGNRTRGYVERGMV